MIEQKSEASGAFYFLKTQCRNSLDAVQLETTQSTLGAVAIESLYAAAKIAVNLLYGSRRRGAGRCFGIPSRTQKDDDRREVHPDQEANDRGEAAVDNAVRNTPDINSKQNVDKPPEQRGDDSAGHDVAHAGLLRPSDAIDHCESGKRKRECSYGEKESPQAMERMDFAEFRGNPMAQRTAKHSEDRSDQQRSDGRDEQQKGAQLAVEKAGLLRVFINNVDTFHDEFHDLRSGEEGTGPTNDGPLPSLRAALNQEFGNNLAAAGRQIFREVGDEVEHVGVTTPTAGCDCDGEQ